ncbi:MAG: transglycosylase SLT domain-containing protein [Polyangiaceae bacterium]|nr:transglycosylase SLT domain-containing protein [Polyangiaceae bacterium]
MVRTRSLQRRLVAWTAFVCGLGVGVVWAEEKPAESAVIGSGRGGGERHVHSPDGSPDATAASSARLEGAGPAKASEGTAKPAPKPPPSHRRGRAPKEPRATLPDDVPPTPPTAVARRGVAQGPIAGESSGGPADPELAALRQAELVLFPRPVVGLTPGWSWELPAPLEGSAPEVRADGFPPVEARSTPEENPETAAAEAEWLRSLTMPNLPVRLDPRVVKYLKFYRDNSQGQSIARAWARKSGRYGPALRAELAKAGVPTDLVWLSLIESGHNPTIRSAAGAAGLWQFIPESARLYGLTVDRWVDERLDPRRSTEAAAMYLSDLFQRFGSWDLAMAAYNMGHGGLSRAIAKYNTNDFWELSRHEAGIPWETTLYVPKVLATAIMMANKKAFGLDGITPEAPASFDAVAVSPGVSLSRVAAAAEVSLAVVQAANPQYLVDRVPPAVGRGQRWLVALPSGLGPKASRKLVDAGAGDVEPYRVRFGDTLTTVAAASGASEARLRDLNQLGSDELLEAGTVLLVPRGTKPAAASAAAPEVIVVAPAPFHYADRRRVFYRVRRDDRLESIAAAFGVERGDLVLWNALDAEARLQSDMVLQVFAPNARSLDDVRHVRAEDVRLLVVGTPEFIDHFEGQKGRQRLVVTAEAGDTLAKIGERFGMTVGSMERVNRRSRRDPIEPGEPIVVYAARPSTVEGGPTSAAPGSPRSRAPGGPTSDVPVMGSTSEPPKLLAASRFGGGTAAISP